MAALAIAVLGCGLAGCGRRGDLEPPPDPSVQAAPASDAVQTMPRRPKRVPITPPHDSFILDPLL